MSIVLTIGVALTFYAWLLSLICTAMPLWTYHDQDGQLQHAGLWKTCIERGGHTDCVKITKGWIRSVQAFMVMAVIVLFISLLCGLARLRDESRSKVNTISTLGVLIGGFLLTTAVIVYGVKNDANSDHFSASFYLSIISAVAAFVASVMFLSFKRYDGYVPLVP